MKLSRSRERSDRHRTHRVNQTGRAVSGLQLPKFSTIRPLIETRCKREWIQGRRGGGRMRRGSGRRPRSVSTRGARTGGNRRSNVPRALLLTTCNCANRMHLKRLCSICLKLDFPLAVCGEIERLSASKVIKTNVDSDLSHWLSVPAVDDLYCHWLTQSSVV